jgi:hypothetical protein
MEGAEWAQLCVAQTTLPLSLCTSARPASRANPAPVTLATTLCCARAVPVKAGPAQGRLESQPLGSDPTMQSGQ